MKEERKMDIVDCLRCSASPVSENLDCSSCPYRVLEEAELDFPVPPDVVIDGRAYWSNCDCDGMAQDAAEVIEILRDKVDSLRTKIDAVRKKYGEVRVCYDQEESLNER